MIEVPKGQMITGPLPMPQFKGCSPPAEYVNLRESCELGQLETVREIVERIKNNPEDSLRPYGSVLAYAVTANQLAVVSYLLSHDFSVGRASAEAAIPVKFIPILEVLLEHGWDIDELMNSMNRSSSEVSKTSSMFLIIFKLFLRFLYLDARYIIENLDLVK